MNKTVKNIYIKTSNATRKAVTKTTATMEATGMVIAGTTLYAVACVVVDSLYVVDRVTNSIADVGNFFGHSVYEAVQMVKEA